MALDNMSDGVGKKIVEALKMQDEVSNDELSLDNDEFSSAGDDDWDNFEAPKTETYREPISISQPSIDTAFQQSIANNLGTSVNSFSDDFDYPANVAVLKQLITKLPTGVSKQTGAQIIKQTMEALGISMKSVLQEAQGVQESLNNSSRECQASIMEYKKQIGVLERQSQKYQRQSSALNDIISLFVQTNL